MKSVIIFEPKQRYEPLMIFLQKSGFDVTYFLGFSPLQKGLNLFINLTKRDTL